MRTALTLSFLLLTAAPAPAPAAETWHIDPGHSSATFSVRHLVVSTVRGEVPIREGTVETEGTGIPVSVKAVLDATKLSTGNENRDADLHGADWFATDKFPDITFASTKITPGATPSTFTMTGNLTMHGVTKSVTLDGKFFGTTGDPRGHKRAGYEATVTVDRRDFGLNWARTNPAGDLVAANDVNVTLDVEAVSGG
jgi:polyisoprenoid-binding protein YceI